jgi:hypothetical protein
MLRISGLDEAAYLAKHTGTEKDGIYLNKRAKATRVMVPVGVYNRIAKGKAYLKGLGKAKRIKLLRKRLHAAAQNQEPIAPAPKPPTQPG